jgi:hypothetical protein
MSINSQGPLLYTHLDDEVSPLGADLEGLERVRDVGAVQQQLHDEYAVLVVGHAGNDVFSSRTELPGILPVHLQEQLRE